MTFYQVWRHCLKQSGRFGGQKNGQFYPTLPPPFWWVSGRRRGITLNLKTFTFCFRHPAIENLLDVHELLNATFLTHLEDEQTDSRKFIGPTCYVGGSRNIKVYCTMKFFDNPHILKKTLIFLQNLNSYQYFEETRVQSIFSDLHAKNYFRDLA